MLCLNCGSTRIKEEEIIEPECCPGGICKDCWKTHRCNILTDSHGRRVNVGDRMRHIGDWREYQVVEILPTFTRGQTCIGEKVLKTRLDGKRHALRTRLMEII